MKTKLGEGSTPGPWSYTINVELTKALIVEPDGSTIFEVSNRLKTSRFEKNIRLAVKAVNHFEELRKALERMDKLYGMMMEKVNHKASFYDAATIREMNEAPGQARALLAKLND